MRRKEIQERLIEGEPEPPQTSQPRFLLEPLIFLLFLAQFMSNQMLTSHIMYQACRYNLEESEEKCALLEDPSDPLAKELETKAQPFVASYLTEKNIIESLIPAVMNLFVGAWSDKNGRKKIMLIGYFGYAVQFFLFFCLGLIQFPISTRWYWIPPLVVGLTGGNCILMSMFMSYMSDKYSDDERPRKMGAFHISLVAGIFIGSLLSATLSKQFKPTHIVLLSSVLLTGGLAFLHARVPESVKLKHKPVFRLSEVFQGNMIRDCVKAITKPRPGRNRMIVWFIVAFFSLLQCMNEGSGVVFYLYLREKFGWRASDFSIYIVAATVAIMAGTRFGFSLQKKLGLDDSAGTWFFMLVLGLGNHVNILASQSWHLYAGLLFGVFRTVPDALARNVLSSVAESNEMGKLNSLIGTIQSLLSVLAAPLYAYIYKRTLAYAPETYLWVNTGIYVVNAAMFWYIGKSRKDTKNQ